MTLWSRDERGQALILIAAALGGLLFGIGLALDTGQLFVARRAAQTAADAGAWAGAAVLYAGGSAAQARTAAATDATRNGYTDGGFISVTTVSPPTSGTYSGDAGYIEVTITEQVATRFLFGASAGRTAITVRAVAGIARSGSGEAVLVTRTSGTAFTITNTDVFISGGGTSTNSSSNTAVSVSSGALLSGTYHRVTGNVSSGTASRMSPAPTTGAASTADPFVSVAGPSTTGVPIFAGQTISSTVTLSPGVYTGLVTVTTGGVARLNPGIYIFRAGLRTTNNGSLVLASAGGVLLYNTYSNYPSAPGSSPTCGTVSLTGTGQLTLAAGRTGSYAGMLLFEDRNCATNASITLRTGTSLSGTLYVPNALLTLSLANNATIASQIVAENLTISGGNTLTMSFTPASITGTRVPSLVE